MAGIIADLLLVIMGVLSITLVMVILIGGVPPHPYKILLKLEWYIQEIPNRRRLLQWRVAQIWRGGSLQPIRLNMLRRKVEEKTRRRFEEEPWITVKVRQRIWMRPASNAADMIRDEMREMK